MASLPLLALLHRTQQLNFVLPGQAGTDAFTVTGPQLSMLPRASEPKCLECQKAACAFKALQQVRRTALHVERLESLLDRLLGK